MTHRTPLSAGAAAFVNEANRCAANGLFKQLGGAKLGDMQAGQVVEVLEGPFDSATGIVYWRVYSPFLRTKGFTPEGRPAANDYWLDQVPTVQASGISHRIRPGTSAFVETRTGKPNILRSNPDQTSANLASFSGGAVVTVKQAQPVFNRNDGWLWWQVKVNGMEGWMAEVNSGVYNLIPLTVPVRCV